MKPSIVHEDNEDGYFEPYTVGLCHASVCTDMTDEQATEMLNAMYPTGISSKWHISEEKTFRTGEPNPKPCEDGQGRRHILFVCSLALMLLGVGCGGAAFECDEPRLASATADMRIDCDALGWNVTMARQMLWTGAVMSPEEAIELTEATAVHVYDRMPDGLGGFNEGWGIGLDWTGGALLHELLHRWERGRGVLDTGDHPGWEEKGYNYLDLKFRAHSSVLDAMAIDARGGP